MGDSTSSHVRLSKKTANRRAAPRTNTKPETFLIRIYFIFMQPALGVHSVYKQPRTCVCAHLLFVQQNALCRTLEITLSLEIRTLFEKGNRNHFKRRYDDNRRLDNRYYRKGRFQENSRSPTQLSYLVYCRRYVDYYNGIMSSEILTIYKLIMLISSTVRTVPRGTRGQHTHAQPTLVSFIKVIYSSCCKDPIPQ